MTKHRNDSERIAAIAALVLPGLPAADIGTDHARVPRLLVTSGRCPRVIAADRSPRALERSRRALDRSTAASRVHFVHADGLDALDGTRVATIVIAGMGGAGIARILERGTGQLAGVRRLVLGPHRDVPLVRTWLSTRAWHVVDERIVDHRGRHYWLLAAEPSRRPGPLPPAEAAYGGIARARGDRAFRAFAAVERRRLHTCLASLPEDASERVAERRRQLRLRLRWLEGRHHPDEAQEEVSCTARS